MEFIFDGNAMLHVATRQAIDIFKKSYSGELESVNNENTPLTDFLKKEYKQTILNYMNSFVSNFYQIVSHIHIVLDNISWRGEYVNKFFERNPDHIKFQYKGKRKADKEYILLNKFFQQFHDEIVPILKGLPGVYVYSTIGAEGDDIIAYLVDKFKEEDIVIFTGDTDIGQLTTDVNRKVILLGPKHITTKKRRISVNETTKAMNFKYNIQLNDVIDNLLRSTIYEKIKLNPGKNLLIKIVTQDTSDNTGSIYVRTNKKGEAVNITNTRGERFLTPIFEKYKDNEILNKLDTLDEEFFNDLVSTIVTEFKIPVEPKEDYDNIVSQIKKNYERNVKLIRLSKHHIPEMLFIMIERVFNFHYNNVIFDYAAFAANIEERKAY